MKCALCGLEFQEDEGAKACSTCAALGGCGLVRCPNCGYEWPKEPAWLSRLAGFLKGKKEDGS